MSRNLNIWGVLDESGTNGAECNRKVASGRRVADGIRSLVNARDLQIECAKMLHETLLMSILSYGGESMLWKEKERSRIKTVQMDILRGLVGIRRMDSLECTDKGVVRNEDGA